MCTGFEIGMLALSGASAGAALLGSQSGPPPAQQPSVPAPATKQPGATVRVGGDDNKMTDTNTQDYTPFVEKRLFGKSLGGLGRGGLDL